MQLEQRASCITDLAFDEWFAGEGSSAGRARLEAHVHACTRCRLRGELLERERRAFLQKAPTPAANARWARRSSEVFAVRRASSARLLPALSAAALVAALAWQWAAPHVPPPGTSEARAVPASGGERLKGGAHGAFYVKRDGAVERGASGDTVHPGDQLRFVYSSDGPAYLALLGRDGRAATTYFPAAGTAARVEAGHDRALDFSLELDALLGEERLYLALCPAPFAVEPLRAALQARGDLDAPAGCSVERIVLHKEPRP